MTDPARTAREDLADAVARAVLAAAGVAPAAGSNAQPGTGTRGPSDGPGELTAETYLAIVTASAQAEEQARSMLHRAVSAARASGISWARIGQELGMTRQAAQQRFGANGAMSGDGRDSDSDADGDRDDDTQRWLGPVTAFDEMAELEIAGQAGWHTVEAAMGAHRMVRTDTQWQHRRIVWRASLAGERAEGWQVGCRSFPWIYLVRDTGEPVLDG